MSDPTLPPSIFTPITLISLGVVFGLIYLSHLLASLLLPKHSTRTRLVFSWHLFDTLVHFILEGSFLYHSFFSSSPGKPAIIPSLYGDSLNSYGAAHSSNVFALLWQEYANADTRWAHADVNIVTIELITVLGAGPLAAWICWMLVQGKERKAWFWIVVLAVGEIYGGWMTFGTEWIAGNVNLNTGFWVYTYLYLALFNGFWVAIPAWLCVEAYKELVLKGPEEKNIVAGKKRA